MASRRFALGVVVLLGSLCFSRPASAAPILGGVLIATGGDVDVTYVLEDAGDVSQLYLYSVGGNVVFSDPSAFLFQNNGSGANSPGELVTLNAAYWDIDAGEELVFALVNLDENEVNDPSYANYGTYLTGPASRNPDGTVHAVLVPSPYDGVPQFYVDLFTNLGLTTETVVAFEDRPNCQPVAVVCRDDPDGIQGDFDYNDLVYAFSNVRAVEQQVPEPASILLFGAGAAACVARRRKHNTR